MARAGAFGIAVACSIGAACSAVPDVQYVDDDAGDQGDARADSAPDVTPPEAGPPDAARAPVQSSNLGCIHNGGETCCGSSVCADKKECEGAAKVEQCTTCAYDCANRRCCVKGGQSSCVSLLAQCPP